MYPVSTIAALATPAGMGAVSIIRLSGPEARAVLARVFTPLGPAEAWPPRLMRLGRVFDPDRKTLLDEALAVWFEGPRSFTGEDSAEIQGHGGTAVSALVLAAALRAGAVLAEPGEFTRRAFMNGRLDLARAEAVADLVAARSAAEIALAARQLAGGLSEPVEAIHRAMFSALVELDAAIDFGEDVDSPDLAALKRRLADEALAPLEKLLADGRDGRLFREGLSLALVGAPNVGKSSLFNALAGADRALVSASPGTTRDFISTEAVWGGLRVELCDTAGLSATPLDDLDARGQERSRAQLARADLVLWVRDCQAGPDGPEGVDPAALPAGRTLVVWNKADLAPPPAGPGPAEPGFDVLTVSAHTRHGLPELKAAILKLATGRDRPEPPAVVPNLRHQAALARAGEYLAATLRAVDEGQPPDICAYELKSALDALGQIRGRTAPDDILQAIFSRFCLGK